MPAASVAGQPVYTLARGPRDALAPARQPRRIARRVCRTCPAGTGHPLAAAGALDGSRSGGGSARARAGGRASRRVVERRLAVRLGADGGLYGAQRLAGDGRDLLRARGRHVRPSRLGGDARDGPWPPRVSRTHRASGPRRKPARSGPPGVLAQLAAAIGLSGLLLVVQPMRPRDRWTALVCRGGRRHGGRAIHLPDFVQEVALGAGLGRDCPRGHGSAHPAPSVPAAAARLQAPVHAPAAEHRGARRGGPRRSAQADAGRLLRGRSRSRSDWRRSTCRRRRFRWERSRRRLPGHCGIRRPCSR